jgi:peptidoglycan hydrolase CwlO-like protein
MSIQSQPIRRTLTIAIAIVALVLGFVAIRAASAWTVSAAPLVASPTSAQATEAQLALEQERSAALEAQLVALTSQTEEMTAALEAAQGRMEADAQHADQLVIDLAAARKRLKALEKSIKQAAAAAARSQQTTATTTSSGSGTSSHDDDDDDEHEDDD